ncbi:hypothetical protein [Pedobacter mendelii]|uniref:DUF4252 domain-containing protein n=1 Tax=Pedobacter mendelii TaxID=1908240 RepID=A0ABQ2BNJ1_9SPHI|nr:hypothetical protein [Pedobacter mendelii]GGI28525.1 hypothetical protein GCM10008119_33080 [Pedobacter mendelii]
MKKTLIICFAFLAIGITSVNAQGILDKIDRSLNKADRATNTADRTNNTAGKIGSLFGKKKTASASTSDAKTIIKLSGVTFASLKTINDNVQGSKGVESTKMKFSSTGSTITVQHSGTTENLLKSLQKTAPSTFTEKNIEGLDDGEISVKIK